MEKRPFDVRYCFLLSFIPLISVFLFWSGKIGYAQEVRGVTDTTIKIGLIADLTGPSAGDIGLPIFNGLTTYTKHINDKGGIFGRKVKLIVEDDRYSIPVAIAGFKKLFFKDRIFAFMGPGNSGAARILYPKMERLKVPCLAAAPDEFTIKPLKRHVFLPLPLYHDQLGVIYDYIINDLKPKELKITFVYFDTESGKEGLSSTTRWARDFDFDFDREIINMGALDALSQAMSIRRKKPSHIVIHHTSGAAAALLRDLKKLGLNIPVFGTVPTCTEDMVRMSGIASRNYTGVHSFSSWYDELEGVKKMRKITLKYKPGTDSTQRSKIYTGAWVGSMILYKAIEGAGKGLNVESMIKAWESIRDMDTKELSGPVNFSPTNHKGILYSRLYRGDPKDARLIPITEWRKPLGEE